jgi:hypothetical protein
MNDASIPNKKWSDDHPQADCARAKALMLQAVDDELPSEESAWFETHLGSCPLCRALQLQFQDIDDKLRRDGVSLSQENPFPLGGRGLLLTRVAATRTRPSTRMIWLIPAAAAFAALLLIGVAVVRTPHVRTQTETTPTQPVRSETRPHPALRADLPGVPQLASPRRTPARRRRATRESGQEAFVPIPYTAPLAPYERATIARMDLAVSALIAAGIDVRSTEPVVQADVLLGQDGRAHAVRILSKMN